MQQVYYLVFIVNIKAVLNQNKNCLLFTSSTNFKLGNY